VLDRLSETTIVIKAAAVADFRAVHISTDKLHREGALSLELQPTEDIVRSVVDHRRPGTLVVAFAAESGLDIVRAREKLRRKGADAIVLNDIDCAGLGFDSDRNACIFLTDGATIPFAEASKDHIADQILDQVVVLRTEQVPAPLLG
jgi:phosphopantothenoylcysteine decarboxylase/phosphopantothenate--cysteine ligase